jgi:hypothetical protein
VEAVVDKSRPAARGVCPDCGWRIGRDSGHIEPNEKRVGSGRKPGFVSGFTHHGSVILPAEQFKKSPGEARVETMRRR